MFYYNFEPDNKIDLTIRLIVVWLLGILFLFKKFISNSIQFRFKREWVLLKRDINELIKLSKQSYKEIK